MIKASHIVVALLSFSNVVAAPANITKRAGGKAGISWPIQEGAVSPVAKFFGPGSQLSWWFNWNKNYGPKLFPGDGGVKQDIDAHFIPMFFDSTFLGNGDPLEPGYYSFMGFNEPDLHSSTGVAVAMSAKDAAASWKAIVTEVRKPKPDVILISPAVAGNKGWLVDFFNAICPDGLSGCEWAPKILSIHVYATSLKSFQDQVNAYHNQFGLDIIVSEFACYSWDGSNPQTSPQQASAFMASVTDWMNGVSWIPGYAWFGAVRNEAWLYSMAPGNRLMDASGQLTALGQQYVRGGK